MSAATTSSPAERLPLPASLSSSSTTASCREVEYPVFLEDCAAGLAWTAAHIAEHGGDPARIALMGHSAGAYNAVMLILGRATSRRRWRAA